MEQSEIPPRSSYLSCVCALKNVEILVQIGMNSVEGQSGLALAM